jgi:hypothetical protein
MGRSDGRLLKNAHMLRCAASAGVATYPKVRLTSPALHALHLSIFEQPEMKKK